jgi:hypothetical protein
MIILHFLEDKKNLKSHFESLIRALDRLLVYLIELHVKMAGRTQNTKYNLLLSKFIVNGA